MLIWGIALFEEFLKVNYIIAGTIYEVPTKMFYRIGADGEYRDIHFEVSLENRLLKSISSDRMEYAILYLKRQLPENIAIACCQSCRYGNFCPYGNKENEIFCFKNILVSSKEAVCRIFIENPELLEGMSRSLLSICEAYAPIDEKDYYTYNSWNYSI